MKIEQRSAASTCTMQSAINAQSTDNSGSVSLVVSKPSVHFLASCWSLVIRKEAKSIPTFNLSTSPIPPQPTSPSHPIPNCIKSSTQAKILGRRITITLVRRTWQKNARLWTSTGARPSGPSEAQNNMSAQNRRRDDGTPRGTLGSTRLQPDESASS
jgi:hypothetical protein